MAEPDNKTTIPDDPFDLDLNIIEKNNSRKTVRYIRHDVKARLVFINALGLKKNLPLELNDISTKGALITAEQTVRINKKVELILTFDDGKVFRIQGKIIRKCPTEPHQYGIKFEKQENDLGDYLLQTQTDLTFK
ncbi:MAG: PilZ domain-containing protein [Gammaproteobacteria bacterium]